MDDRAYGEDARVNAWRMKVLLDAGYSVAQAELVAASDADLHEAVDVLKRGCDPATATNILT